MNQGPRAFALLLIVCVAAASLAYFYIEIHSITSVTPAPIASSTSTPATPPASSGTMIEQASCEAAGGHWNDCGSLCRNQPPGTVCAQVCIPLCECTPGADQCPAQTACTDVVKGTGICKASTSTSAGSAQTFVSTDGVDTVAVPVREIGVALPNPFFFSGTTTAFENMASWKLTQTDGTVIGQGVFYVYSPDVGIPGPYQVTGFYDRIPTSASGTLLVYEASAKDGTPIHVVAIPVMLAMPEKVNAPTVTAYFVNTKKDPNLLHCETVYPVTYPVARVDDADAVAMHALVVGPTADQQTAGYASELPEHVNDPVLTVSATGTVADFDYSLSSVAGSCRVTAIRAQITKTLQRGDPSRNIEIRVNGSAAEALQP